MRFTGPSVIKINIKIWCDFSSGTLKHIFLLCIVMIECNVKRIHRRGKVTSNPTQILHKDRSLVTSKEFQNNEGKGPGQRIRKHERKKLLW
jgi:hypothetical protein